MKEWCLTTVFVDYPALLRICGKK